MARHLFLWLLIGASGCSLALDGPKPNRPKGYAPKCDDNKGLVVADGLLATAVGIGAMTAFSVENAGAGVTFGLIGAAFVASAVRGNSVVNECRAENARYAQENVPFLPTDDDRRYAGQPAQTARAPRASTTEPADPYADMRDDPAPRVDPTNDPGVDPRNVPRVDPGPAPVPARPAPAPRPIKAAPADTDPDAWTDFWTEVP
ncbi:MAG: hypothetical protein ACKV2T_27030 [Kofleriaceae bacterium]